MYSFNYGKALNMLFIIRFVQTTSITANGQNGNIRNKIYAQIIENNFELEPK